MTEPFCAAEPAAARANLESAEPLPGRTLELLARSACLEGRYDEALAQLEMAHRRTRLRPLRRRHLNQLLSLAYFQTNRYGEAAQLPLSYHLTKLMRSFRTPPYQVDWSTRDATSLPFLQEASWELPRVTVEVNGRKLVAVIDTGGDLFSIPWELAESLQIEPVATAGGLFAAGQRARVGWARLERLGLGDMEIGNVPISLNSFPQPVIGTGLLRQFHLTLDYPGRHLVLRQPGASPCRGERFPFLLGHTHLLIARGEVNGVGPMHFLVDSGLEADNGASFAAPAQTLRRAGIPAPEPEPVEGQSGVGKTRLEVGRFDIETLTLGGTVRHGQIGMTGVFPRQLTDSTTIGFPLDGLVSHNFLRHCRWTIDFAAMEMTLE